MYKNSWSLLQKLVDSNYFDFIDISLAEHLSKRFSCPNEEFAALICYLSLALRQGHLCIKVNDAEILPDPFLHQSIVPPQNLSQLAAMLRGAIKTLPGHIVNCPGAPIYCSQDFFYFQRYWQYEQNILNFLNIIEHASPSLNLDLDTVSHHLNALVEKKLLLSHQAAAILKGCKNNITIITGGPGTGKTYTAGELLNAIWISLNEDQQKACRIILAAPTGKAASNLERSLLRATKEQKNFPPLKARTLHSLLAMHKSFSSESENKINAKIIVVDECSMMDANMMSKLLAAVYPGTKLILLGDKHQLPPVSTGMLFADVIEILSARDRCVELQQCLRTDSKGILDLATAVKTGKSDKVVNHLSQKNSPVKIVEFDSKSNIKKNQSLIVESAFSSFLNNFSSINSSPETLVKALSKFCILSPFRQGPFGTEQLNRLFLTKMLSLQTQNVEWMGIPIVISNNNQRLELSNGEMGLLVYHLDRKQPLNSVLEPKIGDYALFPNAQEQGSFRRVQALMLPKYEPAFCLSVHKSQGSEYHHVILLLPQGSESFGREMFYTAVTRARTHLEVWSNPETIINTINNHSLRLSGLSRKG